MLETLVITDLTQMKDPDRVCLVGISESGRCIRPVDEVREKGVSKDLLFPGKVLAYRGKPIIYPRAKVQFDLHPMPLKLPHREDQGFDPASIKSKGRCTDDEWEEVLRKSSYQNVSQIFGDALKDNKWVPPGTGTSSIGSLSGPEIVALELSAHSIKPRLVFKDASGQGFNLPASDLALWRICYACLKRKGQDPEQFAAEVFHPMKQAARVYLRLGLSRPWVQPGCSEARCYVQVTGVHTFPDYLKGKTWAEL